jgi:hypothetical protein
MFPAKICLRKVLIGSLEVVDMGKPVVLLLRTSFLQLLSNVLPCLLLVLLFVVVGSGRSAAALVVVDASSLRERLY